MFSQSKITSLFIQNPEQIKVAGHIGSVSTIHYLDNKMAAFTIAQTMLYLMLKGEKCIVVVSEDADRERLKYFFRNSKIQKYIGSIHPCNPLTEDDIVNIRVSTIHGEESYYSAEDAFAQFSFVNQMQKTEYYYEKFHSDAFGSKHLKAIIQEFALKNKPNSYFYLKSHCKKILHSFDKTTFDQLLFQIKEAQRLYKKDFNFLSIGHGYPQLKETALNPVNLSNTSDQLIGLHQKAREIRDKYFMVTDDMNKTFTEQYLNIYDEINDLISELNYLIEHYSSELQLANNKTGNSILNLFKTEKISDNRVPDKINEIIDTICAEMSKHRIELLRPEELREESIRIFSNNAILGLKNWKSRFPEYLEKIIKSINKLNIGFPEPEISEQEFRQFLFHLNESNIFIQAFEINTLSFQKQAEYAQKVCSMISEAVNFIHLLSDRQDWILFYENQDDTFKKLFIHLLSIDQDEWAVSFENWFMSEVVESHCETINHGEKIALEKTLTLFERSCDNRIQSRIAIQQNDVNLSIKQLTKENPELFNCLFKKKKVPNLLWKHLLGENTQFFSKIFPLLIVSEDDLKDLKPGLYQHIIYFNYKDYNPEILQDYKTIHTYIPYTHENVKENDELLLLNYYDYEQALGEMNLSDRLKASKKLAKSLLSINQKIRIFQMKNASIISFAGQILTDEIIRILQPSGIKEIICSDEIYNELVECLLETDRQAYMILEDELIDDSESSSILWQGHVLSEMKHAGFIIKNIRTHELYKSDAKSLRQSLDDIIMRHFQIPAEKRTLQLV